jgi:glycosyltransferase involved in cell wall biosynthesis
MTEQFKGMKIGYVAKMFPRLSETFVLNEILELERQGAEVVVFSAKKPNEGQFHPQLAHLQARVIYLEDLDTKKWAHWISAEWDNTGVNADRAWDLVRTALAEGDPTRVEQVWQAAWMAGRAAELGVDHLHAHFATLPAMLAHLAHRVSGIPYSFTAHAKDIFVYEPSETRLGELIEHAEFMVTVTEFNRRHLLRILPGIDPEKVKVIHNGIDLESFVPAPFAEREPGHILAVGRLVPKKGFDDLLAACLLLRERGIEFRCTIAGDGSEAEALARRCGDLGLDDVVSFTGPLKVDAVRALMARAAIFALPCRIGPDNNIDALPTVLLESLASGLPAVSTSLSGIPEIISEGVEGSLVPPDAPDALADAIARQLADADLRRRCGDAGREKALAAFDIRRSVGRLYSLFRTAGASEAADPGQLNRLLYVCTDRGIAFGGSKGAAVHVREFLAAQSAAGRSPVVAMRRRDRKGGRGAPYPVHVLGADLPAPSLATPAAAESWEFSLNTGFAARLTEIHRAAPCGAVYERYSLFGTAGCEFARMHDLPYLVEVNAPLVEEARTYRGLHLEQLALDVAASVFSAADHVLAVSEEVGNWVLDLAPHSRVTVLPNGVDTDRIRPIEPTAAWRQKAGGSAADARVIGFVGRVRPWHGVDKLIEALAVARREHPELRLCVVGEDGDAARELQALVRRLDLENVVTFTGAVPPEEIPEALGAIDIAVAPYPALDRFYFSPLKIYEYMAAGRPVVASAIGQISDVLEDGRTGLLVPPGDVDALAAALVRLCREPELAAGLGAAARSEAEARHTWHSRVATVNDLVAAAIERRRAAS